MNKQNTPVANPSIGDQIIKMKRACLSPQRLNPSCRGKNLPQAKNNSMLTHSQYSSIANRIKIGWKPSFFPLIKERGYCYGRSRVGEVRYSIGFHALDSVSLVFFSPQEVFYKKTDVQFILFPLLIVVAQTINSSR